MAGSFTPATSRLYREMKVAALSRSTLAMATFSSTTHVKKTEAVPTPFDIREHVGKTEVVPTPFHIREMATFS
jgi:hypothetical protein